MANPILPGISEAEQELLYKKLNEYNQGRTSYKEAGAYLVVLPRPESPATPYGCILLFPNASPFLRPDLSTDIHESLRAASSLCYYSPRCILLVEYNAKRMQSKGDDIISFGKYHGHFLHEIFRIDPAYVSWIAYKFTPRIPKQERFVQIAQVYHSVHLDIQKRQAHQKYSTSRFLGKEGDKVKELTLKVPVSGWKTILTKTTVKGTTPYFYVRQILTLKILSATSSLSGPTRVRQAGNRAVPATEHAFEPENRYILPRHASLVPLLRETNNTPASIMSSLNKLKR